MNDAQRTGRTAAYLDAANRPAVLETAEFNRPTRRETLPRETWPLRTGEIHAWIVDLDLPPAQQEACQRILSIDESNRANRLRFKRDRGRFVAAHGALRFLLGRYLGLPPADVRLMATGHGKPAVAAELNHAGLQFNLSHSAGLALLGFARRRRIGVDIEEIRPDLDVDGLVAACLTRREIERWTELPTQERLETFFTCWTRKEAFLKARGVGLLAGLNQCEVTFRADEPPLILEAAQEESACEQWRVFHVAPKPGYLGAVITEGPLPNLVTRWWKGPWGCYRRTCANAPHVL